MCIFHKWSKWEKYDRPYRYTPGIIAPKEVRGKVFDAIEHRQRKKCKKCGKVKDILIYDED